MNIDEYRKQILSPISEKSPAGECLINDESFEYIEEQMMKVGSLAHGSVPWSDVESQIFSLLTTKSKDIKLLVHLMQCLHHKATPDRAILSFTLLADFMREYWLKSFPTPGDRGKRARKKFFSLLTQRCDLFIDKLNFALFNHEQRNALSAALESWQQAVLANQLSDEDILILMTKLRAKIDAQNQQDNLNAEAEISSIASSGLSDGDTSDFSKVTGSSQKSQGDMTKQTLFDVANFLAEQEHGTVLSIRLSRYAVWSSIDSLPDHNQAGETQLRGIQPERLKEYLSAIESADLDLWKKVEKSLLLAPYWIDGQFMSATIAKSMNKFDWAEAILEETYGFLCRFPQLKSLTFKDGAPFVSPDAQNWINSYKHPNHQYVPSDWDNTYSNVLKSAKENGISAAILEVNKGLESAFEPRDIFYWRCLLAELMEVNSLSAVSTEQYKTLYQQVTTMNVIDWEPTLVEKLKKKVFIQ